jgi:hypothetical protein
MSPEPLACVAPHNMTLGAVIVIAIAAIAGVIFGRFLGRRLGGIGPIGPLPILPILGVLVVATGACFLYIVTHLSLLPLRCITESVSMAGWMLLVAVAVAVPTLCVIGLRSDAASHARYYVSPLAVALIALTEIEPGEPDATEVETLNMHDLLRHFAVSVPPDGGETWNAPIANRKATP